MIDDKEYEMQTPVMNGANPVKDNSMSQQRVWNSMCRAFVKCVAIHTGLGFKLWIKEEYNKMEAQIPETGDELASEAKKKTLMTQCTAHGVNLKKWLNNNGMNIGSSGDSAKIGSSGDSAQINSLGADSVICCAGINAIAKAKKGSWITLAEWEYNEEKDRYVPLCVKTEQVDGERIKEDTFYKLKNGEFEEVE